MRDWARRGGPGHAGPGTGQTIGRGALRGQREEALAAAQEAVALYRPLAQAQPEAFLPDLAGSLNNLGAMLSELGRREEALAATQEAADLYRQLAQTQPGAFLPYLAGSLNNLGNWLSDLGRREEALAATQEAVELYRQLAQANPQAFLPDLARSLNNLGNQLSALGRRQEALAAYRSAIKLDPQYAAPHNNMADIFITQGKFDEARRELNERIRLAPENPFTPLVTLGILARHQGLPESAQHFQDALSHWDAAWRLGWQSPAGLLENKAIALLCLGKKEDALQALQESIAQMGPGDKIEFESYTLLQTAPQPPEGIEEMVAQLQAAAQQEQE